MSQPVLQGRERELAALRGALAKAREGRGQLLLISGDAGIGKSALAAAVAAEAESRGLRVTWGRAWEFADAPAYFPLWPALRELGVDARVKGDRGRDEEQAFELWEAVLASLSRASGDQPVVWILEDLHAADLLTLDLLTFLVQPVRALRALIVGTLRHQDPRLSERKLRRLERMARDGSELRLEPLLEAEVAALAEQTIGQVLSPDVVRRLVELTGGNPLFVVECARASGRSGAAESAVAALPPTIRQVVLDRIALLPDASRDALASGAVLGREFAAASVARMHDSDAVRISDTLLPAVSSGILREAGPGQLVFSHTLVRDAIYGAISSAERARLHRRADLALGALGESADVLVERARHAIAAAAADPEHALSSARKAAELLEREGAFDRAFALQVSVDQLRAAGVLPPATALDKLHAARVAREAGRADEARRLCEEVISAARVSGDAAAFARAALQHAADVRYGVVNPWQVAALDEALRLLGDSESALGCRVLARLSTALQPADDPSVPTEMARDALRRARATGDDAAILDVLDLGGLGAYCAPVAERIAWAEEFRERALKVNDLAKAIAAWTWLAYWRMECGEFAAFERAVDSALELSEAIGHPRYRWGPLLMASGRAMAVGRFGEAEGYFAEVTQIAALIDDPSLSTSLAIHEVMRAKLMREPAALLAALAKLDRSMEDIKHKTLVAAAIRAGAAARMGDVSAARAALSQLDSDALSFEIDPLGWACLGEALALAGSNQQRRRMLERLTALPIDDVYDAGLSYAYDGTMQRVRGLLEASLGELDAATHSLLEARARASARGLTPWVAQLAYDLAPVLRRAGRAAEAQALGEECAVLARDLGIHGLAGAEGPAAGGPGFTFAIAGDVWTVEHGGRVARTKDSRGMQLLVRLAERSGEEIHVLTLASDQGATLQDSSAGEMLDERALKAYRKRLASIEDELGRAEAAADASAERRLGREKQALLQELSRATGLGGRTRIAGSATERARTSVQRRLRDAIARIREVEPTLGQALSRAVRTGTYCCFKP